jgi:hypothetical protein
MTGPVTLRRRVVLGATFGTTLGATLGGAARAEQIPVDLLLVLAVDVSGSVDDSRFELQKRGYAAAFRSQDVVRAIQSGATRSIGVTMLQWTGPRMQIVVVDWMRVHDAASAEEFAAAVDAAPRELYGGGTSISGAIDRSIQVLADAPFAGTRQVIDVSGDGANNIGRPAERARDSAVEAGIMINGLPILTVEPNLDTYYRDNVIGGAGAFVIPIDNYGQFAAAIQRKLISEIAGHGPRHRQGAA